MQGSREGERVEAGIGLAPGGGTAERCWQSRQAVMETMGLVKMAEAGSLRSQNYKKMP